MAEDIKSVVKEFVYCLLIRGGSMAPTLYYLPPSPPCRSILLLAKLLDLQLDLKVINILEGEQMKPEFVELNPQHCVPTMNDDGLVLWERYLRVLLVIYFHSACKFFLLFFSYIVDIVGLSWHT